MTPRIVRYILPLSLSGVRTVWGQLSLATCEGNSCVWLYNSKSQSPCDMAAHLMAICQGSNFTVYPLHPNYTYLGPWKAYEEPCSCGTVTWSLFAACATCQNATSDSWSDWSSNCSTVHVSSFPYDIPPKTAIPGWAYLPVGRDAMWNLTAARLDLGGPESTATSSSSSTFSGPPKTTGGSDKVSNDGSPNVTGPIVGGVVGGVTVLAILVVGIMIMRRRYAASRRPPSALHGPQGASPYRTMPVPHLPTSHGYGTEPPTSQKLYDSSDPTTHPSALGYESWTTTYTSATSRQQMYQPHGAPLSPNRYADPQ